MGNMQDEDMAGIDDAGIVFHAKDADDVKPEVETFGPGLIYDVRDKLLARAYAFLETATVVEPDLLNVWRRDCRRVIGDPS